MKTFNVGALWIHEYKDDVTGNNHTYMTGYIDLGLHGRVKISLHTNPFKTKDRHPDYLVSRYEPEAILKAIECQPCEEEQPPPF